MMASDFLYGAACICLLSAIAFVVIVIVDLRRQDRAAVMSDTEVAATSAPVSSAVTMTRSQRRRVEAIEAEWLSPRPEVKS